ncbi:Na(+) H(+) antiporter subunit B [hydrothermal vent metagenome]|uniref:Na(+) H(+) antiporter subunit B n=1 Tax=hydrothermal vent metagenome TaxID=652676 RepID=A0A3B0Y144_9ZZZZ
MLLCAVVVIVQRNLFVAAVITGIYSLLAALLFMVMDAVDVAFTEAAVGAGISTILMIATLLVTGAESNQTKISTKILPLLVVCLTGGLLIYASLDLPAYGSKNAPIHQDRVAKYYLNEGSKKTGAPNVVTAVLASYRGYDTLGEVTVVFCAGVGVWLLLGGITGKQKDDEEQT